jgi:hypothetical protein
MDPAVGQEPLAAPEEEPTQQDQLEPQALPDDDRPWERPEEEGGEEGEEELDIADAIARARAEFEESAPRGKDPTQQRIEELESRIELLTRGNQDRPKAKLSENATVDELMEVVDQLVEERVKGYYQKTEEEKRKEESARQSMVAEQDAVIEKHLTALRKSGVVKTKEDEKGVLQTCVNYGILDLFKGAEIWSLANQAKQLKTQASRQGDVSQRKEVMSKLGKTTPIASNRGKVDVRRMTMDDIAAAAMRR